MSADAANLGGSRSVSPPLRHRHKVGLGRPRSGYYRADGARGLASVTITVTTLDDGLTRRLEPRAAHPKRRLATIKTLREAGVPVSVLFAPVIPALNDWELDRVLETAARAGADGAGYVLLRLPHEIKQLFIEWLETHEPDKANRVLSLIRQTRGGELYEPTFGERMRGSGPGCSTPRATVQSLLSSPRS